MQEKLIQHIISQIIVNNKFIFCSIFINKKKNINFQNKGIKTVRTYPYHITSHTPNSRKPTNKSFILLDSTESLPLFSLKLQGVYARSRHSQTGRYARAANLNRIIIIIIV